MPSPDVRLSIVRNLAGASVSFRINSMREGYVWAGAGASIRRS